MRKIDVHGICFSAVVAVVNLLLCTAAFLYRLKV